jgi:hypothetical protein
MIAREMVVFITHDSHLTSKHYSLWTMQAPEGVDSYFRITDMKYDI